MVKEGVISSSDVGGGVTGTTGSCSPSRVEIELEIDPIGAIDGVFGTVGTSAFSEEARSPFRLRTRIRTAWFEANTPFTPTTPAASSLPPLSRFERTM